MPTFVSMNAEGNVDIQSLVPSVNQGEALGSWNFSIQMYGPRGSLEKQYFYILAPDTDAEEISGWWDDSDGTIYSTKIFDEGEGFMMNCSKAGNIQFAGTVDGAELQIPVRQYLSHQGNPRTTSISIQDIIPQAAEGDTLNSWQFTIQEYGERGTLQKQYFYILAPDTDAEEISGWWDDSDGVTYSTKTFAPGEGFIVNASKAGSLVFPTLSL